MSAEHASENEARQGPELGPEPGPGLQRFFDAMVPFLRGEASADELQRQLGASPSPDAHLDFYAQLIAANHRRIMRYLCPATAQACADLHPEVSWDALVADYARQRPSGHWDLNTFGAGLPGWLVEQPELAHREALAQVADYEYLLYTTTRDTRPFDPAAEALNPTASIRSYTHTVPMFVRAHKQGRPQPLKATPVTVLFYRRPSDRVVRFLQPTLPMLLAFAWSTGEADAEACAQGGVSKRALIAAAERLIEAGVIGRPTLDDIQARWS